MNRFALEEHRWDYKEIEPGSRQTNQQGWLGQQIQIHFRFSHFLSIFVVLLPNLRISRSLAGERRYRSWTCRFGLHSGSRFGHISLAENWKIQVAAFSRIEGQAMDEASDSQLGSMEKFWIMDSRPYNFSSHHLSATEMADDATGMWPPPVNVFTNILSQHYRFYNKVYPVVRCWLHYLQKCPSTQGCDCLYASGLSNYQGCQSLATTINGQAFSSP